MKMQLLAGCTHLVREYILQHRGINQTFKECTDGRMHYLKTIDQTHVLDRKRPEPEKGALAVGRTPQRWKVYKTKTRIMEKMSERLSEDMENMRQQFQNMSTPPKPKDDRKSVNLTEKQKQERAAKRRLHCTYYKKRGHVESECNKKKKDEERANNSTTRPAPPQSQEQQEPQQNCAAINVRPPPPPFLQSIPAQQYWDTQRFQ